jgi:hypothetical protein
MLPSPVAVFLANLADRALRRLTGRPPAPPSFEGLLDDLYSHWPPEADERPRDDARDLRAA